MAVVLSQPDIRKAVEAGQIVFSPALEEDQWGQASIDLRLGFSFTVLQKRPGVKVSLADGQQTLGPGDFWKTLDLNPKDALDKVETYTVYPGEFVLAMTCEQVTVPRDMIARIEGRSTYARAGLSMHQTAPWIQPGWDGRITLEITNNGPLQIELTPLKDRPCQLTFFPLSSPLPESMAYGARETDTYQGQTHPLRQNRSGRTERSNQPPPRERGRPARPSG